MAKFNIGSILNDQSKETVVAERFRVENVPLDVIVKNGANFYGVDDVEDLKNSILNFGLQQNLVVTQCEDMDGAYRLVAGHRRLEALTQLVDEGHEEFLQVPCKILMDSDKTENELLLILTNSTTRVLSDYEKMTQATKLKSLLKKYKEDGGEIQGRLRAVVAESLDMSSTQVARYDKIAKHLIADFKEQFSKGNISQSLAEELAGVDKDFQKSLYEKWLRCEDLSAASLKDLKRKYELGKLQEILKEKPETDGADGAVESQLVQLKNVEERKDFINNYTAWGLWKEIEALDLKYYRYDFEDGSYFIATEYCWAGNQYCKPSRACKFHLITDFDFGLNESCFKSFDPSGHAVGTLVEFLTKSKFAVRALKGEGDL